jgi:23S rRNA C2498 (ribose-2'-O)-methylase RlmM
MDERIIHHPRLAFFNTPIADFNPSERAQYDAMLCDMNNEPKLAMDHVVRLSKNLVRGGLLIFTLKLANVASVASAVALVDDVVAQAKASDLQLIAKRHLTYNRIEFTLFFEKA